MPPQRIGKYTLLGEGGFGSAISPALPNENASGKLVEFPGMVTKFMYGESEFNKAVAADKTIAAKIPKMAIGFTPYRKKYTLANIKAQNASLNMFLRDSRRAGKDGHFFMARMPYLGDNCRDIFRTPALQAELAKIDHRILCEQVLKLLRTVKQTYERGYIHADIRNMNVLCDVKTGVITIIDFDWLLPIEEYKEKYPSFFYSHPPEEMFLRGYLHQYSGLETHRGDSFAKPAKEKLTRDLMDTVDDYISFDMKLGYAVDNNYTDHFGQMNWVTIKRTGYLDYESRVKDMLKDLWDRVEGNPANVRTAIADLENNYCLPTIDSFGLGTALFDLFSKTVNAKTPFGVFLTTKLVPGLLDANAYDRMGVDAAIAATEEFMTSSGWAIPVNSPSLALSSITPKINSFKISSSPVAAGGGANHVTVSLSSSNSSRKTRSSGNSSSRGSSKTSSSRRTSKTSSGNASLIRFAQKAMGKKSATPNFLKDILAQAQAEQEAERYVPQ